MKTKEAHVLSQRLRAARQAIHPAMTQRDVAKLVGRHVTAVAHWEAGTSLPNPQLLKQLADIYNVSIEWLLGVESKAMPQSQDQTRLNLVPVVSRSNVLRWNTENPVDVLQTFISYQPGTALAVVIESSAMASTCPPGSYAVVSKAHPATPGQIVLAAINNGREGAIRRLIKDSGNEMLIGDDNRFPTYQSADGFRVIGVVTEVIIHKAFV